MGGEEFDKSSTQRPYSSFVNGQFSTFAPFLATKRRTQLHRHKQIYMLTHIWGAIKVLPRIGTTGHWWVVIFSGSNNQTLSGRQTVYRFMSRELLVMLWRCPAGDSHLQWKRECKGLSDIVEKLGSNEETFSLNVSPGLTFLIFDFFCWSQW